MNERQFDPERLDELLAEKTLFGITNEEQMELDHLLAASFADADSLDQAAAIVSVSMHGDAIEPLPDDLKRRILESFEGTRLPVESTKPLVAGSTSAELNSQAKRTDSRRMSRRELVGWLLAAASTVAVPLAWWNGGPTVEHDVSAADSRLRLIKSEKHVVQSEWTATADPGAQNVVGDVVWSNRLQRGFMRFRGLAKNDPKQSQYQLWIFDAQQDDRFPVDGGVFDIDSESGDVIVAVSAKLQIVDPKMFALTVEKPGGVVVSDRSRLLLIAKVDAGRG